MTHYVLRGSTQWNLLNEVYLLSKFDDSGFSVTESIEIFKLIILQSLSSPKLIFILLPLGKSKFILLVLSFWLWTGHSYFSEVGKYIRPQKTIQTHTVRLKNQKPPLGSGTSHFPWFNQQESRTGFLSQ